MKLRDFLGLDSILALWVFLVSVVVLMSGCNRTLYVPDGTPVRLRETVRGVDVWVLDDTGKPVPSKMDLPEGWFVMPAPERPEIILAEPR